jgi:hypothetical protein
MLAESQVVKMFGRQRYQHLRHAGLLQPFFQAPGYEGTAVYPEHLVRFRLEEDQQITGHRQVPTLVQKSARPRQAAGSPVYLQQARPVTPVPPAVAREYLDLVRVAKHTIARLRRR